LRHDPSDHRPGLTLASAPAPPPGRAARTQFAADGRLHRARFTGCASIAANFQTAPEASRRTRKKNWALAVRARLLREHQQGARWRDARRATRREAPGPSLSNANRTARDSRRMRWPRALPRLRRFGPTPRSRLVTRALDEAPHEAPVSPSGHAPRPRRRHLAVASNRHG